MHATRLLPAVALLLFFPARADDGPAAKTPAQTEVKKSQEQASCCSGEEKAKCPRARAAASSKKPASGTAPVEAAKAARPEAVGAANMVVTRDSETGKLRPATAAELEKLLGRPPLASVTPEFVTLPDGTVMLKIRPEDASYTVATRNADGTLSVSCVRGTDLTPGATTPATPAVPKTADR